MTNPDIDQDQIRERAVKHLKKRRDFATHLLVFVLVNMCVVIIWDLSGDGFFWPVFPIAFWGIGVVMNAWDVWHDDSFTEAQIRHEIDRQLGRR